MEEGGNIGAQFKLTPDAFKRRGRVVRTLRGWGERVTGNCKEEKKESWSG